MGPLVSNSFPPPAFAMIDVENFSKTYSGFRAVQNISFHVDKGEIVGFLGPNGAGKSTTMKVLSGYLPPTDGKISIAGFDVVNDSLEVRKRIGYMPENVPLYTDMRVNEFLRFRAELKRVKRSKIKDRVEIVKQLCSLKDVENKIIGTLSKGYRQRVGLADAMVHDPDLLILDEPTIGLDPNQIRAVRDLIKDLGQHHTILLSTHILSEVELTCNRVLVINRGKIEASDTPANLTKVVRGGGSIVLEVKAAGSDVVAKLKALPDIEDVEVVLPADGDWTQAKIFAKPGVDVRENVYGVVRQNNWPLRELARVKATLEEAFIELTQD
jgi:ABC-2 type transport system ATP-binding protein